ncbi:MAG: type II secretion system protein [Planctomycetota bacterium]
MNKRKAFTLIELLIVLAIITLLLGILLPSISMVRRQAKETAQKAQFAAIDMALDAFKQDYGDYPPSNSADGFIPSPAVYCGAQKLTEALLGWDLQGFHPQTAWRRDGFDATGGNMTYDPLRTRITVPAKGPDTLFERRGPYLEVAKTNVFRLNISNAGANDGLYIPSNIPFFTNFFDKGRPNFVICDVFGVKKISIITTLPTGGTVTTTKMAGSPILYYKANTASKIFSGSNPSNSIYNYDDNLALLLLGKLPDGYNGSPERIHTLVSVPPMPPGIYFYDPAYKIVDQNIYSATTPPQLWPNRPDTYILISAGADHEFGTQDDILNF